MTPSRSMRIAIFSSRPIMHLTNPITAETYEFAPFFANDVLSDGMYVNVTEVYSLTFAHHVEHLSLQ